MYQIIPSDNGFVIQITYRPEKGSPVNFLEGKRLLRNSKGYVRRFATHTIAETWLNRYCEQHPNKTGP